MSCSNSSAMSKCRRPRATPDSRNRTCGRLWKRSTTRGSKKRIHIPPPTGMKLRSEKHHEITVVAPTGFDHDASAFELAFEGLALAA